MLILDPKISCLQRADSNGMGDDEVKEGQNGICIAQCLECDPELESCQQDPKLETCVLTSSGAVGLIFSSPDGERNEVRIIDRIKL